MTLGAAVDGSDTGPGGSTITGVAGAAPELAETVASVCPVAGPEAASGPSLGVVGTSFRVTLPDGRILGSADLVGAVLEAVDETGQAITVRIDGVTRDLPGGRGKVWLHRFAVEDFRTGA